MSTSQTPRLTRRSFAAATGLAAFALTACGGSNGDDGASADGATAASSDGTSDNLAAITFCLDYTPNTNHTGIYVAEALGYFAEEGVSVEIVQPAEDSAEAMLVAGQADLGVSYQDYIANVLAADAEAPVVAVAAVIQHNTSGIMSREEDGVTHPAAMEGLRYATWDLPVEQATVETVVSADGGDFSQVQLVPYTVDDEVSGLKADLFDTVWVFEGWAVANAAVQDYPVNYFSFISIDDVFDFYTPVIAANTTFAQDNPEAVRAFLRAVRRGYEYAAENPDEAADVLLAAVPELDPALVHESQAFLSEQYQADAESWGLIDGERWARFYQWLNDNGLVESPLDVNAGWTMDYLQP